MQRATAVPVADGARARDSGALVMNPLSRSRHGTGDGLRKPTRCSFHDSGAHDNSPPHGADRRIAMAFCSGTRLAVDPPKPRPGSTGTPMHIVVCIKQVPDSAQIRVHPVTNTIMRQGVPTIVNPYDLFALEAALRLRDQLGAEVTVLTMGPPMAEDTLRKALGFGADRAVLLTDRAFAGSDTLATSFALVAGDPAHRPGMGHAGHRVHRQANNRWRHGAGGARHRPAARVEPGHLCLGHHRRRSRRRHHRAAAARGRRRAGDHHTSCRR